MPTPDQLFLLLPSILIVAVLYSSVGHGGASGYLAVISLVGFSTRPFVPIVLTLNVLVASISFVNYRKPGAFSFRRLLPFVVTSIPASYLGGMVKVSDVAFQLILGIALIAAAWRLAIPRRIEFRDNDKHKFSNASMWAIGLPIGLVLGFVSGMIGIGGGVFLSPVLLFLGITNIKGSAAMASAFIVLNSLAGLAGHLSSLSMLYNPSPITPLAFIATGLIGALAGSRWGATRKQPRTLQLVLASVLVFASVKLVAAAFF
jgi:uncharacterized membrane protein YfcA